jgi:hypothetical protein
VKGTKNMEAMNKGFAVAGGFLSSVLDLGVKLLAVGVILQIIFGAAVPFIGLDILANVIKFITALGSQGLVGLAAVGVLAWAIDRK